MVRRSRYQWEGKKSYGALEMEIEHQGLRSMLVKFYYQLKRFIKFEMERKLVKKEISIQVMFLSKLI